MARHGDSVVLVVGWAFGSVLLGLFLLFAFFGGVIAGAVLVILLPLITPFIIAAAVLQGQEVPESLAVPAEQPVKLATQPVETYEPAVPVVATIIQAEGTCPIGPRCKAGDRWVINGRWDGPDYLCRRGKELIRREVELLRRGEVPDGHLFRCQGAGFKFVFQIKRVPELAAKV